MEVFGVASTIILMLLAVAGVYYARKQLLLAKKRKNNEQPATSKVPNNTTKETPKSNPTKSSVGAIKKEVGALIPKHTPYSNPGLIFKEINLSKPYMREKVEQSYNGLGIDWNLKFVNIAVDEETGIANLGFMWDIGEWVHCNVKLNKYAELKTIHEDTRVRVTGTIDYVSLGSIYLKDTKLNF